METMYTSCDSIALRRTCLYGQMLHIFKSAATRIITTMSSDNVKLFTGTMDLLVVCGFGLWIGHQVPSSQRTIIRAKVATGTISGLNINALLKTGLQLFGNSLHFSSQRPKGFFPRSNFL